MVAVFFMTQNGPFCSKFARGFGPELPDGENFVFLSGISEIC
jgi:hypothetical protein